MQYAQCPSRIEREGVGQRGERRIREDGIRKLDVDCCREGEGVDLSRGRTEGRLGCLYVHCRRCSVCYQYCWGGRGRDIRIGRFVPEGQEADEGCLDAIDTVAGKS